MGWAPGADPALRPRDEEVVMVPALQPGERVPEVAELRERRPRVAERTALARTRGAR